MSEQHIDRLEEQNAQLHQRLDSYIDENLRLTRVLQNLNVIINTAKHGQTIKRAANEELKHVIDPYTPEDDDKAVRAFIQNNRHQLGHIMSEAHRVWRLIDPSGAYTIGTCQGIEDEYGDYHTLLTKYQEVSNKLKHIRYVESLAISSYKDGYRALCEAINPTPPGDMRIRDMLQQAGEAPDNEPE